MTFWAYMLHCNGGYFYVGHTDDLDLRIAQHQSGYFPGFTRDHLPVTPVWSCDFPTRDEAQATEKHLKGWSRAKKMALIRGDWNLISELSKRKSRASTSSAYSEEGEAVVYDPAYPEPVEGLPLVCHRDTLSRNITAVFASVVSCQRTVEVRFTVAANCLMLLIPSRIETARDDELWKSTCFELFHSSVDGGYVEYNFSPSTLWAAYSFSAYRAEMKLLKMACPPVIDIIHDEKMFVMNVSIPAPTLPTSIALSAIIEEKDGAKSYWALAHPPGDPDFHHPDCFALQLEAPPKL